MQASMAQLPIASAPLRQTMTSTVATTLAMSVRDLAPAIPRSTLDLVALRPWLSAQQGHFTHTHAHAHAHTHTAYTQAMPLFATCSTRF